MNPKRCTILCIGLLAGATLVRPSVGIAQQTFLPPSQYYSAPWKNDGVSPSYGQRYKCFYFWKIPSPGPDYIYRRYDVYYYPKFPAYVHLYDADAGHFIKKCASPYHPAYDYWQNQWSDPGSPSDPVDPTFDPNAPPTPGGAGTGIPRPPCPPVKPDSTVVPPAIGPIDPT